MPASDHKRRLTAFVVAMAVLIATPLAVVATTQFTDVPTSSVHHDNIDWLKDAGVTSGCNPPDNDEYCPTDSVTRAQMATFMRNLATNQVVDAATAIEADHAATADNADTVGGLTPAQIASASADSGPAGTVDSFTGIVAVEQVTVAAPADGFLQLVGSASFGLSGESTTLLWFQVDDTTCDNTNANISSVGFGYANTGSLNTRLDTAFAEGYAAVTPGSHTVTLCANNFLGGPVSLLGPSISAMVLDDVTITPGLHSDSGGDIPGSK